MRPSKPAFQSVLDLGLRDVGVKSRPRRQAALFGRMLLQLFPLLFLSILATCVIVSRTGAGGWVAIPFTLAWAGGFLWLTLRMARRSPVMVVKVNADGT